MKCKYLILISALQLTLAANAAPGIILNGITTIFGDKRALLKTGEQNYFLAEGQSAGEIELISVDLKGAVTIKNHGDVQTLRICKTPSLIAAASIFANENLKAFASPVSGGGVTSREIFGGNLTETASDGAVGFQSGSLGNSKSDSSSGDGTNQKSNDSSADANSNSQSTVAADPISQNSDDNSQSSRSDPWWLTGSKMVEQARRNSAEMVLNGTAAPQPLTPLTPPGTPAYLIGDEKVFFNHM